MPKMKLKDFITTTLCEIVEGVEVAKTKTVSSCALINPEVQIGDSVQQCKGILKAADGKTASLVTFDIAITIEEGEGASANIGVLGSILKIGADCRTDSSNSLVSKLNFTIPIVLP